MPKRRRQEEGTTQPLGKRALRRIETRRRRVQRYHALADAVSDSDGEQLRVSRDGGKHTGNGRKQDLRRTQKSASLPAPSTPTNSKPKVYSLPIRVRLKPPKDASLSEAPFLPAPEDPALGARETPSQPDPIALSLTTPDTPSVRAPMTRSLPETDIPSPSKPEPHSVPMPKSTSLSGLLPSTLSKQDASSLPMRENPPILPTTTVLTRFSRDSRKMKHPSTSIEVIDLIRGEDKEELPEKQKPFVESTSQSFSETRTFLNPLSTEEEALLRRAFKVRRSDPVIHMHDSNICIEGRTFRTLRDSKWLNDDIINAFGAMLTDLSKRFHSSTSRQHPIPISYMFSSFFFFKLAKGLGDINYDAVSRWTKKANVDETICDLLFFPVHINTNHWALCVVNMEFKEIQYLDPLYTKDNDQVVKRIRQWLYLELKTKKGEQFTRECGVLQWKHITNRYRIHGEVGNVFRLVPRQTDTSSCGVLSLKMADCISMASPIYFDQHDVSILQKNSTRHTSFISSFVNQCFTPSCIQYNPEYDPLRNTTR